MADLSGTVKIEDDWWVRAYADPFGSAAWWVAAYPGGRISLHATSLAPAHVPHLLAAIAEAQAWLEASRG